MKFVNRLSHEDILRLIPFYHVYDFEECQSLQPELRRFKFQPVYGGPYEDVTLGDRYEMGSARLYGVREGAFIEFMLEKFGKEYAEWLQTEELQIARKEVEEYSTSRMEEYSRKVNLCEKLMENK